MNSIKKLSYYKVVALGFLVYFFSYAMRLDYSASLVAIVSDLGITNTAASAAVTGSFIAYGIGQVICGFIGDKISPVKMISYAMLGTVILNFLVSFCSSITLITVLWCFNGVFQAMLWPPLVRFFSEQTGEKYSDAITVLSLAPSIGTVFVYVFVPFVLEITAWRNVFRCMAVFGVIMMLVWMFMTMGISMGRAESVKKSKETGGISVFGLVHLAGLIPVFIIIIMHGALRDGIQTWLPSLVNAQFGFSASSSVLSTAVLPVLGMVSVIIANTLYHKLRNELKTASLMFGIALAATVPLALWAKIPALLSVLLASLISGCMHGVNHMLISLIPKKFSKYGMVSTFSGILNGFTYVGASLSSYGFAAVSDKFGWSAVLISWCITAILGTLICVLKIRHWAKFIAD